MSPKLSTVVYFKILYGTILLFPKKRMSYVK